MSIREFCRRWVAVLLCLCAVLGAAACAGTPNEKRKHVTVFDTDVGTDDAFAVMMLSQMHLPVDYLVATHGNARAEQAVKNAVLLKKYFGSDVTVVAGLPPEEEGNGENDTFHGADGLAGIAAQMAAELGLGERDFTDHISFDEMREALADADEITYIAVGPVTNLAALVGDDELRGKLSKIYLMGGGLAEFNCSHDTEFNFSKNPQAVATVLSSGTDITLFPLDLTNRQTVDEEEIRALAAYGTFSPFITFLEHNRQANIEYNDLPVAILHDCMPVLYALLPGDFTVVEKKLVSDEYGATRESENGRTIHVATQVTDGLLMDTLEKLFREAE